MGFWPVGRERRIRVPEGIAWSGPDGDGLIHGFEM